MKLVIDTEKNFLQIDDRKIDLYSKEAFELISDQWLKVGWEMKYPYAFSWMGRPIIQAPEDMIRMQEVIYQVKPDVVIETGVAHGGSLIYYASLLKAMGKNSKIIGVDIEIREHNRNAIESHEMFPMITLLEGDSAGDEMIQKVKSFVKETETVLVILDSCHTKDHVAKELKAYSNLVSVGSYIVATDGSMRDFSDLSRGEEDWSWNNPAEAAQEFAAENQNFKIVQPEWPFNESVLEKNITHWPDAYLKRVC